MVSTSLTWSSVFDSRSMTLPGKLLLSVVCYAVFVQFYQRFMFFFLMTRRPQRSTPLYSSAASDVYKRQEWHVKDLTDFAVNAWEPSHDTELWKMKKQLHIYVQDTRQGDGEKQVETEPQMVYVLEL